MQTRILLFVASVLSPVSSAFAESTTFNFTYFGTSSGSYSMVSCDYAIYETETLLMKFGVPESEITCSGGILPSGMIVPLSLTARFERVIPGPSPRVVRETYASDPFDTHACDFHSKLVRALVPVAGNVVIARAQDGCLSPTSMYAFEFDVSLPR